MNSTIRKKIIKNTKFSTILVRPEEMFLSPHSKRRFAERIHGVPESESIEYVRNNNRQIFEEMKYMLDRADFMYEGYTKFPGESQNVNIYLYKDIIFIVTISNVLLTVWKTNYKEYYTVPLDRIKGTIEENRCNIRTLERIKKRIGEQINNHIFAIEQFQSLNIESAEIDSKLTSLSKERERLKGEGLFTQNQIKRIKEENKKIVKSVLYGYEL